MTEPGPRSWIEPLLPAETAAACEAVGARKVGMDLVSMRMLGGLAGAFIGLGAMLFTVVVSGSDLGFGPTRVLGGVAFSLGLILVVLAGAELFTGNTLAVMAWAGGRVSTLALGRAWAIVYVANFVGALLTVLLVRASNQFEGGGGAIGGTALEIASGKTDLGFGEAVALGILANALVTLAVWLSISARSFTGKVVAILFPITAFVAAGFEHSIANMYFVPLGLLLDGNASALAATEATTAQLEGLTWGNFLVKNLLAVTIGNVIGGGLLVGAVYWMVYRRPGARGRAESD